VPERDPLQEQAGLLAGAVEGHGVVAALVRRPAAEQALCEVAPSLPLFWVAALAIWWWVLTGGSLNPLDGLRLGSDAMLWLPMVLIVVLIAVVMLLPCSARDARPT
jgi:hypothetical protein